MTELENIPVGLLSKTSRYQGCTAWEDDDGNWYLGSPPVEVKYQDWPDNRIHVVQEGDRPWTLAGRFFKPVPFPSRLWWIICQFQPDPIHDPTVKLEVGRELFIPSIEKVQTKILPSLKE